jgi:hypothetical protein
MKDIFIFTAIEGDIEKLEYLAPKLKLEQIYAYSEKGYGQALHASVLIDNFENMKYLYENFNFDIHFSDSCQMNILMNAVINSSDSRTFKYLLGKETFDLQQLNEDNENILMLSIQNKYNHSIYEYLINHYQFDLNHQNKFQDDVVKILDYEKNWNVFLDLLRHDRIDFKKTYYQDSGYNILMMLSNHAPVVVIDELLKKISFDIALNTKPIEENKNLPTNALLEAALSKNYAVIEYYLNKGYFIDVENLNQATHCVRTLFSKKEDGKIAMKEEKENRDKCLIIIKPYLNIALEREQLEKNVLSLSEQKQSIKNKI